MIDAVEADFRTSHRVNPVYPLARAAVCILFRIPCRCFDAVSSLRSLFVEAFSSLWGQIWRVPDPLPFPDTVGKLYPTVEGRGQGC